MEYLISILDDNDVIMAIAGKWKVPEAWQLEKVKIWCYDPNILLYKKLKEAIFKNSYGIVVIGGTIPTTLEHNWEGIKEAVRMFCKKWGLQYRFYKEDPEYTQYPSANIRY